MAEEDLDVSRRYRALGREQPPSALDDAIRAEARRTAATHPAPLVPPTGRRRWYFPVAAAAIIVLAVAVTVQMEREQPDPDMQPADAPRKEAAVQEKKPVEEKKEAPANVARQDVPRQKRKADQAPAALSAAPEAFPGARGDAMERREAAGAAAARPQARMLAKVEPLGQELERIVELRKQGRDEEADKALAEFRKRYPDFKIPDEMLKRVEKSGSATDFRAR